MMQDASKLVCQSPDWRVTIEARNTWHSECRFEGWQPNYSGLSDQYADQRLLELAKATRSAIDRTIQQAEPPEGTYKHLKRGYVPICEYNRQIVAEQCQTHDVCQESLIFRLEISGKRAHHSRTRNLPFDPRPFMLRLEETIRAELAAIPEVRLKPTSTTQNPLNTGNSETWFNNRARHFQLLDVAGHPNAIPGAEVYPQQDTKPEHKPTKAWPQTTSWLTRSICLGSADCQYEPKQTERIRRTKSGCNQMWRKHSEALFQAFMDANPGVMFRDRGLDCVNEVEPNHRCYRRGHRHLNGPPIDHAELCRLPNGSRFIISQPYCHEKLCQRCLTQMQQWQVEMPNLCWTSGKSQRSWYFPNNANLLLLGTQETLDSINLGYPIPTETQPTGCGRFQRNLERTPA